MSRKNAPLVILGIDAGDVRLIQQWVSEGYLPTFSRFMQKGSWGTTAGSDMISEHGIWVSMRGLSRNQTGYYDFRQLKLGTYQLELKTSKDARANPFWFICAAGIRKSQSLMPRRCLRFQDRMASKFLTGQLMSRRLVRLPSGRNPVGSPQDFRTSKEPIPPEMKGRAEDLLRTGV